MTHSDHISTSPEAILKRAIRIYGERIRERRGRSESMRDQSEVWLVDTARFRFDLSYEKSAPLRYLTLVIDSATGDVVASHINARVPSAEMLRACLVDGVKSSRPPRAIVIDHGMLIDRALLAELGRLGIELRRSPVGMAVMKGKAEQAPGQIERILRSCHALAEN